MTLVNKKLDGGNVIKNILSKENCTSLHEVRAEKYNEILNELRKSN
jgi:hypothetical protein